MTFPGRIRQVVALMLTLATFTARAGRSAEDAIWELRPYRIQVLLAADDGPRWSPQRLERLRTALVADAAAYVGVSWQCEVTLVTDKGRRNLLRVAQEAAQPAALPPGADASADKTIVVALLDRGQGVESFAREFDWLAGVWGPSRSAAVERDAELAATLFTLVVEAFSPQCVVRSVEGELVVLRARATGLPLRDRRLAPLAQGAALRLVRRAAAAGVVNQAGAEEWTYLLVKRGDGRQATCDIVASRASPAQQLAADPSAWIALQAAPTRAGTSLLLTGDESAEAPTREAFRRPVAGGEQEFLGRASIAAQVRVPPAAGLQRITVRDGDRSIVAAFPLLPGWPAEVRLDLATPPEALSGLGEAAALGDLVVEAALSRELLLAQARQRVAAGVAAEAEALLKQAGAEQDQARVRIAERLTALRGRGIEESGRARFASTCDRLAATLDQMLAAARIDQVRAELFPPPPPPPPPPDAAPTETPPAAPPTASPPTVTP